MTRREMLARMAVGIVAADKVDAVTRKLIYDGYDAEDASYAPVDAEFVRLLNERWHRDPEFRKQMRRRLID